MTAPTSYTPSSLGFGIDLCSKALSFASNVVEGSSPQHRILTTKYIFVQSYIDTPKEATRILTKLSDEDYARKWHIARRVVWAATIVLPILDTLAALLRQFAKLDYAIRVRYDAEDARDRHKALKMEQKAVKKSIQEFARYLLVISGKEKNSTYQGALERSPDEQYARFCSHFAGGEPREIVARACHSICKQLDACYPKKSAAAQALYDAFHELIIQNGPCDWMKGSPETASFQTILHNYELFYNES